MGFSILLVFKRLNNNEATIRIIIRPQILPAYDSEGSALNVVTIGVSNGLKRDSAFFWSLKG
jgi:hypothetical protein